MDRQNKIEIINYYDKGDFASFLEHDYSGKILKLLDDEGIDILSRYKYREDRICYILSYSSYKNQLFENDKFLNLFLKTDTDKYYAVLHNLNFNSYDSIMNRAFELDMENHVIARLFGYFSTEYQLHVLKNWPYSERLLYYVMENAEPKVLKYIIENYNIDLTKYGVNIAKIFDRFKDISNKNLRRRNSENYKSIVEINFPSRMFDEKIASYMWDNYDIYKVRMLINDSEYFTDSSSMNDYIKKKENKIINRYDDSSIVSPFGELFNMFYNMTEALNNDNDDFYKYRKDYIGIINKIDDDGLYDLINDKYSTGGYELVKSYLQELSNKCISNYIIDYNFQENYHNIMIDIRELLHFYDSGHLDIPMERIDLYKRILNIDSLSASDKKELHNFLTKYDMVQIFYDDMSFTRRVVNNTIKEYSLTKDSLLEYKDEKLSNYYGVPVYKMNNKPFFGIVKSGVHQLADLPSGYSYSLIGNNCLATFGKLTYLYDSSDLNPEQIVHIFPYDSFTSYRPFENNYEATNRVYTLMTPDELVGSASDTYNEVLILEKGKKAMDIDKFIPNLKQIALYCVDKITDADIANAKAKDLGIILVSTDDCKIENNLSDKYRHIGFFDYNYFEYGKKSKYEIKR